MSVSLPAYAVKGNEKSAYVSLDNIDAVQAMEIANQWKWTRKEVKSYVTPQGVIFIFPDKRVKGIPLPKDKMVVAVAPYINQTHRWMIHYMSSCQGELVQKKFQVKAVDRKGNVLVDRAISTMRNGFFELWLPRDRKIELEIKGLNRSAKGTIETFNDSKTCITTFQLR
jgi:hypothetical protein